MSYPIVNKKRYKLLGYNNDDDNNILKYIQYIRYKEKSLQSIDIPKEVYDKFGVTYDLNNKQLDFYRKNAINLNYNILLELSDEDILNFVLEDGYDIDTIDIYKTGCMNVPNILFTTNDKIFAFNKTNYIRKKQSKL